MAINDGQIQMAELAQKQAESADVKELAKVLANDHRKENAKVRTLKSKEKLELKSNELSTELSEREAQTMSALRGKSGREFDRHYVEVAGVQMHQEALDIIDRRLMPGIQSSAVKSAISDLRSTVADHHAKAESLLEKMAPKPAAAVEAPASRSIQKGKKGGEARER